MALNAETEAILKDLESSGFDLSTVRTQAKGNPILESAANSKLGGGILRRQEFLQYKTSKDTEVQGLQDKIRELAAAHDSAEGFKGNNELYTAALEKITILEDNLIAEGYNPDEVRGLSFKEKEGLKAATDKAKELEAGNARGGKSMPDTDEKDYVETNQFQQILANVAGGTLIGSMRATNQINRAIRLGIEITDEMLETYEKNLLTGLENKKSYEQIADETFGIAAKLKEVEAANRTKEVDAEVRKQVAEKLKEAGVSTSRSMTSKRGLFGAVKPREVDESLIPTGEGGTKIVNGRKVPVNKSGETEYYKLRGGREEGRGARVAHAIQESTTLEEKYPEVFEYQ